MVISAAFHRLPWQCASASNSCGGPAHCGNYTAVSYVYYGIFSSILNFNNHITMIVIFTPGNYIIKVVQECRWVSGHHTCLLCQLYGSIIMYMASYHLYSGSDKCILGCNVCNNNIIIFAQD